ncbi:MAG: thiamine-phosphate kinase [Myxococcales bacterium]|nr:thiamine-phosphate kinase [Myxococcales bacterium]MCB9530542.1 thiamine-phosphate kinase [Myxococcales bacterium]
MDAESAAIERLRAALGAGRSSPEGIGDDGAVLLPTDGRVVACDALVEGVHFDRTWSSWQDVAYKALATNVSDIWAMGAEPTAWLLALGLPSADVWIVDDLVAGFAEAQRALGISLCLVGGDTVRAPVVSLTLTVFGALAAGREVVTRAGAVAGMTLWLDGVPGVAHLGLAALRAGRGHEPEFVDVVACHRRPVPRRLPADVPLGAAMDVSDGLVTDLRRMCRASEVGAEVRLPLPGRATLADAASSLGEDVDAAGLFGGDDYLRLVAAWERPGTGYVAVGGVVPAGDGLTLRGADGTRTPLTDRGFRHFDEAD